VSSPAIIFDKKLFFNRLERTENTSTRRDLEIQTSYRRQNLHNIVITALKGVVSLNMHRHIFTMTKSRNKVTPGTSWPIYIYIYIYICQSGVRWAERDRAPEQTC